MFKKILIAVVVALVIAVSVFYFIFYKPVFTSNITLTGENEFIYIRGGSTYEDVYDMLVESVVLNNPASFDRVAGMMNYKKENVPAGRYKLVNGWSNRQLVSKLRSGNQDPLGVVINNIRTIHDLAGKAAQFLEPDSLSFLSYLTDVSNAEKYGFNLENFLTMFIPNTYEMFWTTTPEKFVQRMQKEHDRFWTEEKLTKIKQRNLNKTEAYIVASIVEKESNYAPERPAIAGVYLNRLDVGMKLQADPTVVFATGQFELRRVLYSHLEMDSPYNTYKYAGLPPGPICMPSISSINAVIQAEKHDYIFFCAKADNSGQHVFASTFSEHNKNASAFSAWMNQQNIR